MPIVGKQSDKVVDPRKITNPLDRIMSVQKVDSGGIKLSLYGKPKTGKTRLISTFPKPVLIIGSEDGTRSIRNVPDVDFLPLMNSGEVRVIIDRLKAGTAGKDYRSVGLDTASRLNDMILAEILGIEELPAQKGWGMASRDQYGQCSLQLKTILRELLSLPQNVVITAHERNFNDEGGGGSDMLTPTVGSALSASVCNWLNGAVEYVCQTFIRNKTEEVELSEGITTSMATGKGEYCLRTGPHAAYMTGFRVPVGVELPELIVNPTYQKIIDLVNGKILTSNKPTTK